MAAAVTENRQYGSVDDPQRVRDKIIHVLRIYPVISDTMLQGGLGPQVKPAVWRQVLEDLIEEGIVLRESVDLVTPTGRYNTYKKLFLHEDYREFPEVQQAS